MTDKRVFLAGLAAGAAGGLLMGRRLAAQPRRMPHLAVSQQVLAETRGSINAALLAARAQARYDELYARRPHFDLPALRKHLNNILCTAAPTGTCARNTGVRLQDWPWPSCWARCGRSCLARGGHLDGDPDCVGGPHAAR